MNDNHASPIIIASLMLECNICMETVPPHVVERCAHNHAVCAACLARCRIDEDAGTRCIICRPHAVTVLPPPPPPPQREAFLPDDEVERPGCVREAATGRHGAAARLLALAAGAALFKLAVCLVCMVARVRAPEWARFSNAHELHWLWQGLVGFLALAGLERALHGR